MRRLAHCIFIGATMISSNAHAIDQKAVSKALQEIIPGANPEQIRPSEIPGLYEVVIGAKIFYISKDSRYLIQGNLIDLKERENLTEQKLGAVRLVALQKIGERNMIVFRPDSPKHFVYIFTDIDCGYCRKLHSEIDQYLKAGIEIRYLFYPRSGIATPSYDKAVSVWCADDRNDALTKAKKGEEIPSKTCDNPIDEHFQLGIEIGAQGTPMLVTDRGDVLPGYVPARELAKVLDKKSRSLVE